MFLKQVDRDIFVRAVIDRLEILTAPKHELTRNQIHTFCCWEFSDLSLVSNDALRDELYLTLFNTIHDLVTPRKSNNVQ